MRTHSKEYQREQYRQTKEQHKKYMLDMVIRKGFSSVAEYARYLRSSARSEVFDLLGRKCIRCGFSDERALQIDHVNGDGRKEARSQRHSPGYYKKVAKEIKAGSKKYQILCANCNWIKRHENNEQF